jgi:hypothetical protein
MQIKSHDDELAGRIVVVVQNDLVKTGPFGLYLVFDVGPGDDVIHRRTVPDWGEWTTLLSLPSQRQRLLLPGTSDECRQFHCSIICPQDAQHLPSVVHIEPVWQVRLRVLPLDRASIAW